MELITAAQSANHNSVNLVLSVHFVDKQRPSTPCFPSRIIPMTSVRLLHRLNPQAHRWKRQRSLIVLSDDIKTEWTQEAWLVVLRSQRLKVSIHIKPFTMLTP